MSSNSIASLSSSPTSPSTSSQSPPSPPPSITNHCFGISCSSSSSSSACRPFSSQSAHSTEQQQQQLQLEEVGQNSAAVGFSAVCSSAVQFPSQQQQRHAETEDEQQQQQQFHWHQQQQQQNLCSRQNTGGIIGNSSWNAGSMINTTYHPVAQSTNFSSSFSLQQMMSSPTEQQQPMMVASGSVASTTTTTMNTNATADDTAWMLDSVWGPPANDFATDEQQQQQQFGAPDWSAPVLMAPHHQLDLLTIPGLYGQQHHQHLVYYHEKGTAAANFYANNNNPDWSSPTAMSNGINTSSCLPFPFSVNQFSPPLKRPAPIGGKQQQQPLPVERATGNYFPQLKEQWQQQEQQQQQAREYCFWHEQQQQQKQQRRRQHPLKGKRSAALSRKQQQQQCHHQQQPIAIDTGGIGNANIHSTTQPLPTRHHQHQHQRQSLLLFATPPHNNQNAVVTVGIGMEEGEEIEEEDDNETTTATTGNYGCRRQSCRLIVLKQPEQQHRARYASEGSRGAIKDRSGTSYCTIQLVGYYRPTRVQLYAGEKRIREECAAAGGRKPVVEFVPHSMYRLIPVAGKSSSITPCKRITVAAAAADNNNAEEEEGSERLEIVLRPENQMIGILDCVGIMKICLYGSGGTAKAGGRKKKHQQQQQTKRRRKRNAEESFDQQEEEGEDGGNNKCNNKNGNNNNVYIVAHAYVPLGDDDGEGEAGEQQQQHIVGNGDAEEGRSKQRFRVVQAVCEPIRCVQQLGTPDVLKMSLDCAESTGGAELFLIGRNFDPKNTRVLFREYRSDGTLGWSAGATIDRRFLHQCHIVCTVPAYPMLYRNAAVSVTVVCGTKQSHPRNFVYIAAEREEDDWRPPDYLNSNNSSSAATTARSNNNSNASSSVQMTMRRRRIGRGRGRNATTSSTSTFSAHHFPHHFLDQREEIHSSRQQQQWSSRHDEFGNDADNDNQPEEQQQRRQQPFHAL